ncbi:MAG: fibronectin type III-like domain-contianing protein [Streptosporangiaceae bacterium]
MTGAEVAQLYLTDPAAAGEPPYQLKGFQKITLAPGRASGSPSTSPART